MQAILLMMMSSTASQICGSSGANRTIMGRKLVIGYRSLSLGFAIHEILVSAQHRVEPDIVISPAGPRV